MARFVFRIDDIQSVLGHLLHGMGRYIMLALTNPFSYAFNMASWHASSLSCSESNLSS
jgi:hypothetical protein